MPVALLSQPGGDRLGDVILRGLSNPQYASLQAGIAFAKSSGVQHLLGPLAAFRAGGNVRLTIGIDHQGTSLEAVQDLYLVLGGQGCSLYLLRNPLGNPAPTFHPKLWLFEGPVEALLVVGSGNLTGGGLYTNYEAAAVIELDLTVSSDLALCVAARTKLSEWQDPTRPEVVQVTDDVLRRLHESGDLPSEAAIRRMSGIARVALARMSGVANLTRAVTLFAGAAVPPAPPPPPRPNLAAPPVVPSFPVRITAQVQPNATLAAAIVPQHKRLIIMLRPQHKTELYFAKVVATDDPAFFGFPFRGLTQPRRSGDAQPQPDPLPIVDISVLDAVGGIAGQAQQHPLKMWTYSVGPNANDDFRFTLPANLRALVPNDAILVMEHEPRPDLDFGLTIFPPGHPDYAALRGACTKKLPNSSRWYGWE